METYISMFSKNPNQLPPLEAATIPTTGMNFLERLVYLTQKSVRFVFRYWKNPRYVLTYLRYIVQKSYHERARFMSDEDFLKQAQTRSTLRLQDGEFTLLLGTRDLSDEQKNNMLTSMWKEAIASYTDTSPYMLGIPPYILIDNATLHTYGFAYLWMPAKIFYRLLFPKRPAYFNGSYFYIDGTVTPFLQAMSYNHDVILVSNSDVIEKVKTCEAMFFDQAQSISYVETPKKNTFSQYEHIMQEIESKATTKTVIFMACGAAGKAMIYNLAKKGIRSHDIGWGLTGAYTGESREHFLKWDVFGKIYHTARKRYDKQ